MTFKALRCPECGAPVTVRARACAYCATPLAAGGRPLLERGAVHVRYALDQGTYLPGTESLGQSIAGQGLALPIDAGKTLTGVVGPALRDSAVSIEATVVNPFAAFGVMARVQDVGAARLGWMLLIRPALQSFSMARFANTPRGLSVEALQPWQPHASVQPIGARNHVELRCADAWFDVVVNGQPVLGFEDARFLFGQAGWQVTAYEKDARVILHAFEIGEIE